MAAQQSIEVEGARCKVEEDAEWQAARDWVMSESAVQARRLEGRSGAAAAQDDPGRRDPGLQLGVKANAPRMYGLAFPHGTNGFRRPSHFLQTAAAVI